MYRQKAFHTKREDTQMSLIRHHSPRLVLRLKPPKTDFDYFCTLFAPCGPYRHL